MTTPQKNTICQLGCWALSPGIASASTIGCMLSRGMSNACAGFLGVAAFFVSNAMLGWLLCRSLPLMGSTIKGAQLTEFTGSTVKVAITQAVEKTSAPAGSQLKPAIRLVGEADLASRKGTWRYAGSDTATDSASLRTAPKKVVTRKAFKGAALQEYVGAAPKSLDGPWSVMIDDLRRIKAIGPKVESLCRSLGFFHLVQVANWRDHEVTWVDANLKGSQGRVKRGRWVAQAIELAKG